MSSVDLQSDPVPTGLPEITVRLGNEKPIPADKIGRFIVSAAQDYRRETGGELVLARLELGSTTFQFVEAAALYLGLGVDTLEAYERVRQFAKFWVKEFHKVDAPAPEPVVTSQSAVRMLEIAADSGADITIQGGTGPTAVKIKMEYTEVSYRAAIARENKQRRRKPRRTAGTQEIEEFAARLSAADPHQLELLIEAFVELLRSSGSGYLLPQLAETLEDRGLWGIAEMVRRHIGDGRNRQLLGRD